jgi:hypothetical protein
MYFNQSKDALVNNMQKYINNISFESSFTATSTGDSYFSLKTRNDEMMLPNTQILFSSDYYDVSSQNFQLVTNYDSNPINKKTIQEEQQKSNFRPITKKTKIINYNQQSSNYSTPSSVSSSSTTPSSVLPSPVSSSYNSPNFSLNRKYNKQTPKKVLPVRSEAIDLSEHIQNAKNLKEKANKVLYCTFCKNNGESEEVYSSHVLKDSTSKITCPVLFAFVCPICGESGDKAHTLTYCKNYKKSKKTSLIEMAQASFKN